MFHFANAAMLPLLGEMLAKGQGRSSMMFMSACVVTTQFVITLIASWSGRKAGTWGRKPLLLIAFGVLPVRGVLYTLTANTGALVAIQILDGVAAGIFGVVSVLVIADLTQGSGRFNLTLGAISTAVGIGASLSQVIAGSIVHHFGSNAGFLFLAAVASAAFGILYFFMPETRDKQFLNPTQEHNPMSTILLLVFSNVFMTFFIVFMAFAIAFRKDKSAWNYLAAFVMLLLVFVTDFAVITLATDHVRPSRKPETWNIGGFVAVAVALGAAMVAETLLLLWIAWSHFGLATDNNALYTFSFLIAALLCRILHRVGAGTPLVLGDAAQQDLPVNSRRRRRSPAPS